MTIYQLGQSYFQRKLIDQDIARKHITHKITSPAKPLNINEKPLTSICFSSCLSNNTNNNESKYAKGTPTSVLKCSSATHLINSGGQKISQIESPIRLAGKTNSAIILMS